MSDDDPPARAGADAAPVTAAVDVTVVVSTLDRPEVLSRCLAALRTGAVLPSRVVVVDQGRARPAEAAVEAARALGLPVDLVEQPRLGLSASQNAGVAAASTPVVAIVDDDCVPDRQWVRVVQEAFAGSRGPLLLTGRVLPLPPVGDRTVAVSTRDGGQLLEWSGPPAPMPWHLGTGGNFAVTRAAYLEVGGNDERLGTGSPGRGGNDLDLFSRLVAAGVPARYDPALLVHHERSTAAGHRSRRWTYGFGVGAVVGLGLRARRADALAVLAGWVRLRVQVLRHRRGPALQDEARVLAGTVAGLVYGLRAAPVGPRD